MVMDLGRRRNEEFEIDPNSAFNKLKKLQKTLKEEIALKDIFNKNKEEMMNEIQSLSQIYFHKVIKTKEQYDNSYKYTQDKTLAYAPMIYYLAENSQSILPQCIDPLTKLLFYFRKDYRKMLNVIKYIEKSKYEELAFFITHCFYQNILSPDTVSDRLLLLIYFLLEQEIDKLSIQSSVLSFLDVSFLSRIFKNLSRKEDVKSYLRLTLSSTILKVENDDDKYLCLDFEKVRDSIKEHSLNKSNKPFPLYFNTLGDMKKAEDVNKYLFSEMKPSRFSIPNNQHQSTKAHLQPLRNSDEKLENYFLYSSIEEPELEFQQENQAKEIRELTKSELDSLSRSEADENVLLFLLKQLSSIDDDPNIFTTNKFIKNIKGSVCPEKIVSAYKISFAKVKEIIDELLFNLLKNASLIPHSVKCICAIISKLIKLKFPDINNINTYSFIGKFFFDELILPILYNPLYNGILTTTIISEQTRSNMVIISKIIKKIIRGNLYNGTFESEYSLTLFNVYIMEIIPSILKFFEALVQVKLPNCIEQAFTDKEKGNTPQMDSYDYFKEHSNEKMEHQSICFTWSDFLIFFDAIKKQNDVFISDLKALFTKTYKKLTFHENTLRNKIESNENENIKTYLLVTSIVYSKEFEMKIVSLSKEEEFSFESCDSSENTNNEKFILARVKYCISTIIRHLNILTRANFFIDASESTENFVLGLNKMIELEGFSEMLREKTIPLSWFGLYLQSNIENIPVPHRRANYFQLYEELLKDSYTNLDNIQKDESLNYIFTKTQNCKRLIGIIDHSLQNLKKIDNIIELNYIILTVSVPVIIREFIVKKECIKIEVVDKAQGAKKTSFFDRTKSIDLICNTILEFIEKFPKYNKNAYPDTVLPQQEKLCFKTSLESYYDIMAKIIYKDQSLSNYTDEQKSVLIDNIATFIQRQLYDKIFPLQQNRLDMCLMNNAHFFCGMNPELLLGSPHIVNKRIIEMGIKYYRYIDKVKCPIDKLEAFSRLYELVKRNFSFYCGAKKISEDQLIDALAYLIFIAQPRQLYSNFSYIDLYISEKKRELWKKWIALFFKVLNRAKLLKKEDFLKEAI